MPQPTLRPTRTWMQLLWCIGTFLVLLSILLAWRPVLPSLSQYLVPGLLIIVIGVWWQGRSLKRRLLGKHARPYSALYAARVVALGKASSVLGPILVGLYSGTAVGLRLIAPPRILEAIICAACAVISVILSFVGRYIEKIARIDPPESQSPSEASGSNSH